MGKIKREREILGSVYDNCASLYGYFEMMMATTTTTKSKMASSSAPQSKSKSKSKSKSESESSPSGVITQALLQKKQQPHFLFGDDDDDYSNSFDDDDDDHDSYDDDDDHKSEVLSLISVSGFVAEAVVDEVIRLGRSVVGVGQCASSNDDNNNNRNGNRNGNSRNNSRIPGRGKRLEFVFDENDRVVDLGFFEQKQSPPPPKPKPTAPNTRGGKSKSDIDIDVDVDDDDDDGELLTDTSSGLDTTLDTIEYYARNNSFVSYLGGSTMGSVDENDENENFEIEIENNDKDENDIAVARVVQNFSTSEKRERNNTNNNNNRRSHTSRSVSINDGNRDDAEANADVDLNDTLSTMGTIFTDFMQQQEEASAASSDEDHDDNDDDIFDDISEESSLSNNSTNLSLINEDIIKTIEDAVATAAAAATNVTPTPNDCEDDVNNDTGNSFQQYYDNKEVSYEFYDNKEVVYNDISTNNDGNIVIGNDDDDGISSSSSSRIISNGNNGNTDIDNISSAHRTTNKLGFFKNTLSSISGCSSKSSTNVLLMNNKRMMMSSRRQEEDDEEEDGIIFHDDDHTRMMNDDMYVDIIPVLKHSPGTNKRRVNNNDNNKTKEANHHLERESSEELSSSGSSDRRGRRHNNQDQQIVYNRETFAASTTTTSSYTNNASSGDNVGVINNNKNVGNMNTSYEYHYDNKEVVFDPASVVKTDMPVNNDIPTNNDIPIKKKTRTSFSVKRMGKIRSAIMSNSPRHKGQEDDYRNHQQKQDEGVVCDPTKAALAEDMKNKNTKVVVASSTMANNDGSAVRPTTKKIVRSNVKRRNSKENINSIRYDSEAFNNTKKKIVTSNFAKMANTIDSNAISSKKLVVSKIKKISRKGSAIEVSVDLVNTNKNENEESNVIATNNSRRKQKDDSDCKNRQGKEGNRKPEVTTNSSVAITKSAHYRITARSDHRKERRNWFGRGAKKQKPTKDGKCEKEPNAESIKTSVTDQNRAKRDVISEWTKQKQKTMNVTQSAEILPSSHNDDINKGQAQDCFEAVLTTPVTNTRSSWLGSRTRMKNKIGSRQQKRHESSSTEAAPLKHDTDLSSSAVVGGCEMSQQKQQIGSNTIPQLANEGSSNHHLFDPQQLLCGFDKLNIEEERSSPEEETNKMIPDETKDSIFTGPKSQHLQNFKQRANRRFILTTADSRTDRRGNPTAIPLRESLRKKNFENDIYVNTATNEEAVTSSHQLGTSKAPPKKRDGTNNDNKNSTILLTTSSSSSAVQCVDNEDDLTRRRGNVRIGVEKAKNENEKDLNSMRDNVKIRVEETKNELTTLTPSPISQGAPPSAGDQANHGKDMAEFLMKVSSFVDDFVVAKRDPTSTKVNAACEALDNEKILHLDRPHDKKHDGNVGANVAEISTDKMVDVVYIPTSKMENRTKKKKKSTELRAERQHLQNNDESQLDDGDSFPILEKRAIVPTRSKDSQLERQHSKKMNDESRPYPDEQGRSLDDDDDDDDDSFPILESLPFRAVVSNRQSNNSHAELPQQTKKNDLSQINRDEWIRSIYGDGDSAFQLTGNLPYRAVIPTSSKQPSNSLPMMKEEPPHSGLKWNIIVDDDDDDDEHSIESLPYRVTASIRSYNNVSPFPLNWEDNHKTSSSNHRTSLQNDGIDDNEKHNRTDRKVTNNREQKGIPQKVLLQPKKIEPPGSDQFLNGDNSRSNRCAKYVVDENGFIVDKNIAVLEDIKKSSTIRHTKPPPSPWESLEKKRNVFKEKQIMMDHIPISTTTATTATTTTAVPYWKNLSKTDPSLTSEDRRRFS